MMTNKRETVESKGLDVEIGKLDIRLKGIDKVLHPPPRPPAPAGPRMPTSEERLTAFLNQNVGVADAAEKARAKVKAECKDPVECEKRLRLIDQWEHENF